MPKGNEEEEDEDHHLRPIKMPRYSQEIGCNPSRDTSHSFPNLEEDDVDDGGPLMFFSGKPISNDVKFDRNKLRHPFYK
jgi:hypothetical protein